jgi:hypothetical protein
MPEKMRIVWPTDPDFEELLESDRLMSGAGLNELWHSWNAGEFPDLDAGDEVRNTGNRHA